MNSIPAHVRRQMMTEPRFVFMVSDRDQVTVDKFASRVVPLSDALKDLGPHEFLYYVKAI